MSIAPTLDGRSFAATQRRCRILPLTGGLI